MRLALIRRGKYFQFKGLNILPKWCVPVLTGFFLETPHTLAGKNFTNLDPLTPGSVFAFHTFDSLGTLPDIEQCTDTPSLGPN